MSLLDRWNKNKFSIYKSEEKSVLKLIENINNFNGELAEEIDQKTDLMGDHKGSWQGLSKPTLSEEGMRATVEKINEVDIPKLTEQVNKIAFADPIYYGADPTGLKPSSSAINNCIIANKGKSIKFTPGKYLLDKPILTPYFTDEQVNIDFNGSTLFSSEVLEYVIGVGCYNYSNEIMPNRDNYNNKTCYSEIKNVVIDAPNTNIGIFTNDKYWYPRLKNISIFNTLIGIKVGNNIGGWSSDLYLENALIQCRSYKISNCVGIILNGNDNKLINCRLYNAPKGMIINSEGNVFDNIHFYLYGHLNDRDTLEFRNIYPTTIAIVDNGNNNLFDKIYTDSYSTHYKVTKNNYRAVFSKCIFYTNVTGYDDVAFDFSSCSNVQYLIIKKCNINLRNAGVNGNIGLKVSATQRADDMCLNWDISENITSYITKDLLLIDRNKNYVYPFSGSYKMQPNIYYIVGYIPVVSNKHSYTVNITGTGSTKQRGRFYINGSGVLSEINNQGAAGSDFGIGGKIVTLNDNRKYIEVSIMTKYEKSAILGIQFDCNIDGFNYGIIPIYERHIHGDPNSNTTTPTITQTFSA